MRQAPKAREEILVAVPAAPEEGERPSTGVMSRSPRPRWAAGVLPTSFMLPSSYESGWPCQVAIVWFRVCALLAFRVGDAAPESREVLSVFYSRSSKARAYALAGA